MNKRDFKQTEELLRQAGLPLTEASYDAEAFGSWHITLGTPTALRVVWDGRDQCLLVYAEVLCWFDRTNHNYGSAELSEFFFDGNDNPPWDCWVGVVGTALAAWVPSPFIGLAEAGIAVECTDTLSWLTSRFDVPKWLRAFADTST